MRTVVYITAGYLIFEGQQRKSAFLDPTCKAVWALLRKSRSSTRFRLQAAYTFGRAAELLTLGLSEPPSSSPSSAKPLCRHIILPCVREIETNFIGCQAFALLTNFRPQYLLAGSV